MITGVQAYIIVIKQTSIYIGSRKIKLVWLVGDI